LLILTEVFAAEYNVKFPDIGIRYKWNKIEQKPVITGFEPNSSAQRAGVQVNDRIVFSGKSASTNRIFMHGMWDLPIGKKVKTLIYREDKIKVVHIEVGYYNARAYYNNNLVKKKLSFISSDPILLRGLYSDGLAMYALIKSNFVAEIVRVSKFEKDPNDACEEILNSFYILYDRSKKRNKHLHKDIYSLLNFTFYEYLSRVVKKYSKLEEKDILESEDRKKVVEFMEQLFSTYYLPNYSDIPELQKTYNQIKLLSTKISEEKQTTLTTIQKKYKDSKGGWKFLKWGMSVKEVKNLLNFHNSSMEKGNEDPVILNFLDRDSIQTDLVKIYYDQDGSLYFYQGKLMGRYLNIRFDYYIKNHEFIAKKLKEKYQKGKIYEKEQPGIGVYKYYHFKLATKNLNIFTLLAPPRYAGGGIYYYDPQAIRNIFSKINQQHQKVQQGQRNELKNKF
jgi:hypothetical protein